MRRVVLLGGPLDGEIHVVREGQTRLLFARLIEGRIERVVYRLTDRLSPEAAYVMEVE